MFTMPLYVFFGIGYSCRKSMQVKMFYLILKGQGHDSLGLVTRHIEATIALNMMVIFFFIFGPTLTNALNGVKVKL